MNTPIFPLTAAQSNILTMSQYYTGTSICNIGGSIEFDIEGLSSDIIIKAVNHIVEQAEGLRLRICNKNGSSMQYVSDYHHEHIPVIDMRGNNKTDIEKYIRHLIKTPIELYDAPLYRFVIIQKKNSWVFVYIAHHIISDAWTSNLFNENLIKTCEEILRRAEISCKIAPYTDHIANEQKYLASIRYQKDTVFWNEVYKEKPKLAKIKPGSAKSVSPAAHRLCTELDSNVSQKIRAFCIDKEISPAIVFEAAMFVYLNRINPNVNKPSLGLAVLNRDGAVDRNTMGMFISTIPLSVRINKENSLMTLCGTINDTHMLIFRHQKYPYTHIIHNLREIYHDVDNLYDVMVSYQNATMHSDIPTHTKWYSNGNSEVAVSLHIDDRDHVGKYVLNMDYQLEQFDDEEAKLIQKRVIHIVKQMVENPELAVSDVSIIPDEEYDLIVNKFNYTKNDYPSDECVHQLFEAVTAKIPDEIAVVFEGASYTYAEINRMANCIAHTLRRGGIGRNDIVPIIAHRSHLVLAAQLGVLKASGAYLPIDPTFPAERITYMLDDASCKAALILDADAPTNVDFVIDLADESLYATALDNLDNINEPSDLCYVIYTSGSTGKPKGTMLTHRNVVNYSARNEFNVAGKLIGDDMKKFLSITTIGFDIYVTESLLSLLNGLTIYYANDDESKMQKKLSKLVIENEIEIIQTTPTKMKMYMQDKSDLAWLSYLKVIILGGEVFPESLYEELREYTDARIFNIYGPTETTVWSSVDEVTSPVITIGNPIANTQILICNEKGELCPVGIAGELCIAGDGVCRGYLNREELTAEKFIDNPYVPGKLYKTGDLASYRTDGKLLCYGRIDSQVKIRGLRVELGEIESVMNGFDGIVLSATTVKTSGEHQYLVGYYVAEGDIDEKKLREHILAQLPKYMCPHYFMRLEKIAFTPNGKIDRKNLPDVDFESRENHNEIKAPETPLQQEVYEVLCDFIKGTAFGIDEDFFDLGMDSLTAINLTSALSKKYACELSVNDVYKFNTVEKMAEHLSAFASHTKKHDLVLIKDGGDANLFLVHGGNGVVGNFVQLSTQIETNYNWYGVDYPMNEEFYYPHVISIPELAAQYVERIRAVQPHGPYHLCGYCIGGQIVLEMAYLLEQAGEKVAVVYNIATPINDVHNVNYPNVSGDDEIIVNVLFGDNEHNKALLAERENGIWQTVYNHINNFELDMTIFRQKINAIMNPLNVARAIPDYENADAKTILCYVNFIRSLIYGGKAYSENHVIHAPIHLFTPNRDRMIVDPPQNDIRWQEHTTEKLTAYLFDGDHSSWFEEGQNEEFLNIFEKCLLENYSAKTHDLVLIKDGGESNLFLVHGGNGVVGNFVQLSTQIETDYNWYGVDYPMKDEFLYPHTISIPELAAQYVERIRAVQPNGPYHLCGYCIGGQIVLEMAYLLEQAGEEVENISLIAAVPNVITSQVKYSPSDDDINITTALFGQTAENRVLLSEEGKSIWEVVYRNIDEFKVDLSDVREKLLAIMKPIDLTRAIPDFYTGDLRKILYYVNLIRSLNYGSGIKAEHHIVHAPINLFTGDKDAFLPNVELNTAGWKAHTTEKFTNHMFDGDHFSWYESGNNKEFLTAFQNMVQKGGAGKLLLLKSGTDKNIFFIHGGNGLATAFVSLCNKADISATCWGLDMPYSEDNYYPQLRTIHEMALWYIERIKKVQPHGPYTFCGYCLGGPLALEMTHILEQSGEKVEAIYAIASLANDIASQTPGIDTTKECDLVIGLLGNTEHNVEVLKNTTNDNVWDVVYEHLNDLEIDDKMLREMIFNVMQPVDMKRSVPDYDTCDIKTLLYYTNLIRSLCHTATTFKENRIVSAPIYLFSANKDRMVPDIELNAKCWQSHTMSDFENIIYDGDHFNMFESENNDDFCEKFEECLKKRSLDK